MTEMGLNIGMLWYDNNKDWGKVVMDAASYYETKYGKKPTLCVVHPSTFAEDAGDINGIQIIKSKSILPKHYWIGTSKTTNDVISEENP